MKAHVSIEQIYNELFDAGLTQSEIDKHISNVLYYRWLDTLQPSEAILRQSLEQANKSMMDGMEMDFEIIEEGDEGYDLVKKDIKDDNDSYTHSKEVKELRAELVEMRDKMNDLIIEKYTQPVEIENKEPKVVKKQQDNNNEKDE